LSNPIITNTKIAILSNASSAGRTLIACRLFDAAVAGKEFPAMLACFDIDKPDMLGLLNNVELKKEAIFAPHPVVDSSRCKFCGECSKYCPEKAIQFSRYIPSVTLIVSRCSACGNCIKRCQRSAIKVKEKISGTFYQGQMNDQHFIIGTLNENSENKVPLIQVLLERIEFDGTVICDFGPGDDISIKTGLSGMNAAVIVITEADNWKTDLEKTLALVGDYSFVSGVVINKNANNDDFIGLVTKVCNTFAVPLIGVIPYNLDYQVDPSFFNLERSQKPYNVFQQVLSTIFQLINRVPQSES
jgi:MinD superfamily P-loop ATPase